MSSFQITVDGPARDWLESHPTRRPRVIAYEVHRCCGGGKICHVNVRDVSGKDDRAALAVETLPDGTELLVDKRAAARLPARFGLTVRGLGPMKHLDLDLDGEQWGRLLYD